MNIGGQFHSISHAGMKIFDQTIESTVGGLVIDLASAPITPGEHKLAIDVGIGGIEIFLPKYVKFTVEGGAAIGGHDVHEGPGLWNKLVHKTQKLLNLSNQIPTHAVEQADPAQPVSIHFVIDGTIGGIDIYRL